MVIKEQVKRALLTVAISLVPALVSAQADPIEWPEPEPEPVPTSLLDRLVGDAGGAAVILVRTDSGIVAKSPDGSWAEEVVTGPIALAVLDNSLDLLWFIQEDQLEVLDLRAIAVDPVPIVRGIPQELADSFQVIRESSGRRSLVTAGSAYEPTYLRVMWTSRPTIAAWHARRGEIEPEYSPGEREVYGAMELIGDEWLTTQLRRAPGQHSPDERFFGPEGRDPELAGLVTCDGHCGETVDFGISGWRLTVVESNCGEWCTYGCLLYDPETAMFADPTELFSTGEPTFTSFDAARDRAGSCGLYRFDTTGYFLMDPEGRRVCLPSVLCAPLGGAGIGFLGGSIDIGFNF